MSKVYFTRTIKPGNIVYLYGRPGLIYQVISEAEISDSAFDEALRKSSYTLGEIVSITEKRADLKAPMLQHFECARVTAEGKVTGKTAIFPKISLSLKVVS